MYRGNWSFPRTVCSRVCLVLSLVLLFGVVAADAYANPGAMSEPVREQKGVVDPLVERIQIAIRREAADSRYDMRISNFSDHVLLQGDVDSQASRERIVSAARTAAAKPVRDELRIRPAPADDQVAASIRFALEAEYPRLASRIKVDVRDGVAYFSGDLSNHREVDELLSTSLMVHGVKDVRSDITLKGKPYAHQHLRVRQRQHY
jgi:osmotically-inducible protein OsmY